VYFEVRACAELVGIIVRLVKIVPEVVCSNGCHFSVP
jgi:hypothetical protein